MTRRDALLFFAGGLAVGVVYTTAPWLAQGDRAGDYPWYVLAGFFMAVAVGTVSTYVLTNWNGKPRWSDPPPEDADAPSRLVYDVLDDRPLRASDLSGLPYCAGMCLAFLGIAIYCVYRNPRPYLEGWYVFVLLFALGEAVPCGVAYLHMRAMGAFTWRRDQFRCKEWRSRGEYTTTEGLLSGWTLGHDSEATLGLPVGSAAFRVGDLEFLVGPGTRGGFRLDGCQGTGSAEFLADGVKLRLLHRDGRILRVEVTGFEVIVPAEPAEVATSSAVEPVAREGRTTGMPAHAPEPPVPAVSPDNGSLSCLACGVAIPEEVSRCAVCGWSYESR